MDVRYEYSGSKLEALYEPEKENDDGLHKHAKKLLRFTIDSISQDYWII